MLAMALIESLRLNKESLFVAALIYALVAYFITFFILVVHCGLYPVFPWP